jgi:hypothetical protein
MSAAEWTKPVVPVLSIPQRVGKCVPQEVSKSKKTCIETNKNVAAYGWVLYVWIKPNGIPKQGTIQLYWTKYRQIGSHNQN